MRSTGADFVLLCVLVAMFILLMVDDYKDDKLSNRVEILELIHTINRDAPILKSPENVRMSQ